MSHVGTTAGKDGILSDIFAVVVAIAAFTCIFTHFWISASALLMAAHQMQGGKGDFKNIDGAGAVFGFMAICGFIANPLVFLIVWFAGIYVAWYAERDAASP